MTNNVPTPELLAPAGQPESGYAALHYGADAVYLGLNRFSARAEAVNFTANELTAFVAHAHSLAPRRNVYLTLNTLVQQRELPAALKTLETAADCNVDAVIVQDWGVVRAIRTYFPHLPVHASTQMAIHNIEGARMARRLGCSRVTLARELSLGEIAAIVDESGIAVETFIHGTLCYAYSGLCLFSSMTTGRSGNRGKCVYSCRGATPGPDGPVHPFSLKDMALGPRVLDLVRKGVTSLKIEGRKKSPLYVAATVDYYRRILDGTLDPDNEQMLADRLKTIFARPWTTLFLDTRHNPDAADIGVVGHRGAPLGTVDNVVQTPAGPAVSLTPRLPVERHDGVQIDLPGQSRPYGFAVDNLYISEGKKLRPVFAAPAGGKVAVALPPDVPPLTPGLSVYLSSSQEVKRSYPVPKPKGGGFGRLLEGTVTLTILPVDADASVSPAAKSCRLSATAYVQTPEYLNRGNGATLTASAEMTVPWYPARDSDGPRQAATAAFARTGASRFRLNVATFTNEQGVFVKPGDWNGLRRDLLVRLEKDWLALRETFRNKSIAALPEAKVLEEIREENELADKDNAPGETSWSICVDRVSDLTAFSNADFDEAAEIIVCADPDRADECEKELDELVERCEREKIRIAVPLILRPPESNAMRELAVRLEKQGWRKWFASNAGALELLVDNDVDVAADWTLYTLNALAAEQLALLGCTSFTFSPEDDAANMRRTITLYPERGWVLVYTDTPLFISAACVHSHLGLCRKGRAGVCPHQDNPLTLELEKNGNICIQPLRCGSVATGSEPFSLTDRREFLNNMGAKKLRIDLRWRRRNPADTLALWRSVVSGEIIPGRSGNFDRGLL